MGCVPGLLSKKLYSLGTWKIRIKSHRQILQRHIKDREGKGPSQGMMQTCEPQERNPCEPKFEDRTVQETLQQERCARNVFLLKKSDKATFHSQTQVWVMLPPSAQNLKERAFVVDSGASMHMLSKKDLSSGELETIRKSRNPTTVVTANWEVQACEKAQVYVHDLDLFVTVQLLEETPDVLSLGKPCEEHGYTYEWASGQKPQLTKQGIKILCKTENFVPVVPGLPSNSCTSSSSTSLPQDSSSTSSSPATERTDDGSPGNWRDSLKKPKN